MSAIYTNEVGKSRLATVDVSEQSKLRKEWFSSFEQKLRSRLPDLLRSVKFRIVGSVAKNQATAESDIDIVISSASSNSLTISRIRQAIFSLLKEMRESGMTTYPIEVQKSGNPLIFSNVAMFRRSHRRNKK